MNEPQKSIQNKMSDAGLSELVQTAFCRSVEVIRSGADGMIAEDAIEPVQDIADIERLADLTADGKAALPHTVMLKLNGGLGTSMGLDRAKSLLPVRDGMSFLEIIGRQVLYFRREFDAEVPVIFMNSFRTEQDTLDELSKIDGLTEGQRGIPFSFLQNKVPKLRRDDHMPVSHPADDALEWCPPGHGDLYVALTQSGVLERLIAAGYRYLFVSNADNLGASLDIDLLGYLAKNDIPFLMEVADRTSADKKGGHIARRRSDGQLVLREIAQTAYEDIETFQDVYRHRYFNTNSIWINLNALANVMESHDGIVPLPIIVNEKTVDPSDDGSTPVIQMETAMGAALEVFPGSEAVRVPRSRFLPVKKTNDLLLLTSDYYTLLESGSLERNAQASAPDVDLDSRYFKKINDFQARFPHGAPSLKDCTSFQVTGDVQFGKAVSVQGAVSCAAKDGEKLVIEDGTSLKG
ncbi:MAG: UTP--glucose-1-phosphate uridylyltransferase [Pseudomonadota bacterium]